eukprot:scaffold2849_cov174-Amphora_coffeaeformis.AAC.15
MTIVSSLRTAFRHSLLRPRDFFTRLPCEARLGLDGRLFSSEALHALTKSKKVNAVGFGLVAASAAVATTAILMARTEEERISFWLKRISTESNHHYHHFPAEAIHFFEPGTVEDIQFAVCQIRQALLAQTTHSKDTIEPRTKEKVNNDFPSLAISTFNDNCGEGEFELNAPEPIPIENDFFKGKIHINVRPNQKNREQSASKEELIQGQFKRGPRGALYVGAELADADFQLNRLFRGLSGVLLGLLAQRIGNNIQYSLGERAADGKRQLPHIAFPIQTGMATFLVTPPGETPPVMRSEDFTDTTKATVNDWKTDGTTYSMAFRGSGIDLTTWRVIEPFDVSLHRFWGKAPLRLVIYEKGEERGSSTASIRDQIVLDANNYLLGFQVEFRGTNQVSDTTEANRKKGIVLNTSPLGVGAI